MLRVVLCTALAVYSSYARAAAPTAQPADTLDPARRLTLDVAGVRMATGLLYGPHGLGAVAWAAPRLQYDRTLGDGWLFVGSALGLARGDRYEAGGLDDYERFGVDVCEFALGAGVRGAFGKAAAAELAALPVVRFGRARGSYRAEPALDPGAPWLVRRYDAPLREGGLLIRASVSRRLWGGLSAVASSQVRLVRRAGSPVDPGFPPGVVDELPAGGRATWDVLAVGLGWAW